MFIAWIEPPSPTVQGDQIYRTVQPITYLAQEPGVYTLGGSWLHPQMHEAALSADVLVLCQAVDADFLPVLAARRARGLPTLMEINDNFLHPRALGGAGHFYQDPAQPALAMQLAHEASGLVVSTPYLAQLFGHLNPQLLCLPNGVAALPPPRRPAAARAPDAILRVGWAGSAGHAEDLQALMPSLRQVLDAHPQVVLCIMAPKSLHGLFAWAPRGRIELRPEGSMPDYLRFVATLDVGLAPLTDTPFNRGRSDVKFVEYAQAQVPAVLSAGPAYQAVPDGELALKASSMADFVPAITRLVADPVLRRRLGDAAYTYVAERRSLDAHGRALREFIAKIDPQPRMKATASAAAWRHACGHAPRQKLSARAGYLTYTSLQLQLIDGLQGTRLVSARQAGLQAAIAAAPQFYVPRLYAGSQGGLDPASALAHLTAARALAPQSVSVAHAQMRHGLKANDAAATLAVAMPFLPDGLMHAPSAMLRAQAMGATGDTAAQVRMLLHTLAQVPWYREPAVQLATLAVDGQVSPEIYSLDAARDLLQAPMARATWSEAFVLGRVLRAQGAFAAARAKLEQADAAAQAARHTEGARMCAAHLAEVCLKLGDSGAAVAYLRAARDARPASTH